MFKQKEVHTLHITFLPVSMDRLYHNNFLVEDLSIITLEVRVNYEWVMLIILYPYNFWTEAYNFLPEKKENNRNTKLMCLFCDNKNYARHIRLLQ